MKLLLFLYLLFVTPFLCAQLKIDSQEFDRGMTNSASRRDAEKDELGYFSVQNFTSQDYRAHLQNWFITQDQNGFIYSANGDGILEYDGASWRLISRPGLHAVRTVVVDKENVKWVGADRDLGYLKPDSLGFLQFKSLKDKIPPSDPLTGNVWQIFPDKDRTLFASENTIYSWTGTEFLVIPHSGEIQRRYQVNGDVYFRIYDKGMYQLVGDSLQLIPDGEKFRNLRVEVALPYKNNSVLFASREGGLFCYNGVTIEKIKNDVDDYLIKNNVYAGILLSDSSYAFATLRRGVVMMDKHGGRIREITTEDGILNNQVYGIAQDNHNRLWLALQTGISQIEPYLPYTFYNKDSGLQGTVSALIRHKGTLYVGTYDGLFAQEQNSRMHPAKFHRIEGIQNGCFSLLSLEEDLIGVSADGIFLISDGKVVEVKKLPACRTLLRWKKDPSRIFVGHRGGLSSIYFKDGQWRPEKDFTKVDREINSIAEDDRGDLWLGTTLHELIKIQFPALNNSSNTNRQAVLDEIAIKTYGDEHGLPRETNSVYLIDGELLVHTHGGSGSLLKFDHRSGRFIAERQFGRKYGLDSLLVHPAGYQNEGGHILVASRPVEGKSYLFSASKDMETGSFSVTRVYDERFRTAGTYAVYWEHKNLLWLAKEEVIRYDASISIDTRPSFRAYIRKVALGQDSVIFGGEKSSFTTPVLNHSNHGLRFEFAAPSFMEKETNRYQYRLVGFDVKWSEWTNENRKDYTNLPEGDYQFMIRAQDIYGQISSPDVFSFTILAPWYRTWWAFVLYTLLIALLLFSILQLRARKLKSEKKALELLVEERTEEIQFQADQLKTQAEKLQELDQAKSRFFANISHEFRTPLTLISGCLEDLIGDSTKTKDPMRLGVMQKNTRRLQQLIGQLLDLSKLESGRLKLAVQPMNPAIFLTAITSSFSSWAEQKKIELLVTLPENTVPACFDEDVLEKIVDNLLSNAIKFTPDEGKVSFTAQWNDDEMTIQVKDNGPGIPPGKLKHIFERFFQAEDSVTRTQEGSGIGLALVKELISLHHGQITVESQPWEGTVFRVSVPIHERFYTASEIGQGRNEVRKQQSFRPDYQPTPYAEYPEPSAERSIILIVEDNIDLAHYVGDHLPDCAIILAGNGADGLKKAKQHVPDLIISDVMMPEMDGVEFCKKIKEEETTSHIPVILLTAKADIDSRLEGLETGADDYMTKPFEARELQTRVRNLIIQRQKLIARFSRTVMLKPRDIAITSRDETFLEKVMAIIEKQMSNSEFSADEFHREIGMSRMQLHRKLKALTGHPIGEFIRIQRLVRASEFLSQSDGNVSDACYQTGFTSLSYFAKCFKKQFGVTPKDYASTHSQIH